MQNKRTPSSAARQIASELGQSSPKGTARLACALAEPSPVGHTPGPWTAYNAVNGRILNHWRIRGDCVRDDPTFATIDSGGKLSPEYEAANAKLIAAAPELLEVARAIDEAWTGGESGDWRGALDNALLLARAAIAKATKGGGGK